MAPHISDTIIAPHHGPKSSLPCVFQYWYSMSGTHAVEYELGWRRLMDPTRVASRAVMAQVRRQQSGQGRAQVWIQGWVNTPLLGPLRVHPKKTMQQRSESIIWQKARQSSQ